MDFHIIFEKDKGIKGEITVNSLKRSDGYDGLYLIKFPRRQVSDIAKYRSLDLTNAGKSHNSFISECGNIFKNMEL